MDVCIWSVQPTSSFIYISNRVCKGDHVRGVKIDTHNNASAHLHYTWYTFIHRIVFQNHMERLWIVTRLFDYDMVLTSASSTQSSVFFLSTMALFVPRVKGHTNCTVVSWRPTVPSINEMLAHICGGFPNNTFKLSIIFKTLTSSMSHLVGGFIQLTSLEASF